MQKRTRTSSEKTCARIEALIERVSGYEDCPRTSEAYEHDMEIVRKNQWHLVRC